MAEKLVDMAYTQAELKADKKTMAVGPTGSPAPYPWGLCLRLESKELQKLGIDKLPAVGDEIQITAVAKVTNVCQSASETRSEERNVALQITQMEIGKEST